MKPTFIQVLDRWAEEYEALAFIVILLLVFGFAGLLSEALLAFWAVLHTIAVVVMTHTLTLDISILACLWWVGGLVVCLVAFLLARLAWWSLQE